jgi:thimet oligopeptidase
LFFSFASISTTAQQQPSVRTSIWAGKPSITDFEKAENAKLEAAAYSLAALLKTKGSRTIENTLEPFDEAVLQIDDAYGLALLTQEAHPNSEFRDKGSELVKKADSARKALELNRSVYDALVAVDLSKADPVTKYYLKRRLRLFRLAGVGRSDAERAKLNALQDQLSNLQSEFDRNINEDNRTILANPAELEGLPANFIESHKPDPDGMAHITTDDPDYNPVMKFAVNDGLRLRLYQTYLNRAYPKNQDVLMRMLRARSELAQLLGYSSWADYSAASRMAGNAKTIANFIADVDSAARPVAEREFPLFLQEKRKLNPSATDISEYEYLFLNERTRRATFVVDSSLVREYLSFPAVKHGLLDIASKFFQVEFRQETDSVAWDSSVETWDVLDHGSMLGKIYLDLHPRQGKPGNVAEAIPLRDGRLGRQFPEAVVIANFPLPSAQDPGLMEVGDVVDLFHEFGHAMHKILSGSRARWAGAASGNLEPDFMEVPSQFFEKFPVLPAILPTFARHYKTNQPIPTELVKQIQRAVAFGRGLNETSFNAKNAISFDLHEQRPANVDLDTFCVQATRRYSLLTTVPGTHVWASFYHLADYSSSFYTYHWDLLIVEDLFSQFDRENPLAPEIALRYRRTVLEPGGSVSANDLVRNFLGRSPNFTAFRKWLEEGLPVSADSVGK